VETNERFAALVINRLPGIRPREKLLLLSVMAAEDIGCLKQSAVEAVIGRKLKTAGFSAADSIRLAEQDEKYLTSAGIKSTFYTDPGYPALLREIYDPPLVLFYRGFWPRFDRPAVAVVGTRQPTGAGLHAAFALGRSLAECGLPTVSGLARGIDRAAHEGFLSAPAGGGTAIGVMGNGIDDIYPVSSRSVARRIMEQGGALVSEYPPGVPPWKHNFPARNRIISGLCRATVVVQAPARSGALITAEYALEHGRDLFVHAAGTSGAQTQGTQALAAQGAPVIATADEIARDWGLDLAGRRNGFRSRADRAQKPDALERPGEFLAKLLEQELEGCTEPRRVARHHDRINGRLR
jgi:DNA processing protein